MTVAGTGIDIVEVERIRRAIQRWGKHFLEHVFCPEEILYCRQFKFPEIHFAARFAAKEAVFKAFGGRVQLGWKDIVIVNDEKGKPLCRIQGNRVDQRGIMISLSHTKTYAIANAIITPEG